ncbi:hypothetical protein C4N9_20880 [Pararhodobacter marinus]|uniref:Uncharacterized protein n=1 Tax=Pararhodobacter marinus TaxID=2184063 RepID=A0A2U2C4A2_9RHOB|nr:hypothetical protein [Pararhodobacter marinus]PWE26716.1 hypothetical protein C4N9_20880 [Pararhodobacter marinus]
MKITNMQKGPRGFWHNGKLIMLEAGQSIERDLSEADGKAAESTGFFAFDDEEAAKGAPDDLDALKARADELGVEYGPRIGAETLRERIAEAEKSAA